MIYLTNISARHFLPWMMLIMFGGALSFVNATVKSRIAGTEYEIYITEYKFRMKKNT